MLMARQGEQPVDLLRQRTLGGIAWAWWARVGQQAIQFAIAVLLARLLAPTDFGLIGMVTVLLGFATVMAEFGLGSALIHRREVSDLQVHSAFWLNILAGLMLFGGFVAAAPFIAEFYRSSELKPLVTVLSLNFVIGAFGVVPRALLQRRMLFKQLARIDVVAAVLSGILALTFALGGWGVWSLVAQSLVATFITAGLASWSLGWMPRLVLSTTAVRKLFSFSANMLGFNVVNYWARNLDNVLVGRILGAGPLGIYSRAYSLMLLPVTQLTSVLGAVMFPALASIQGDKPRVKRVYVRAIRLIAFITFPMMVGLFVVAESFVFTLLGPQWGEVVPIIRILCVVGATQSLCNPVGWIYMSQGRTDWMFRWGLVGSGTLIVAIVIGAKLGSIESIAWAYTIANLLLVYPSIAIPGKLIGLRFREIVHAVYAAGVCAILMGLALGMSVHIVPSDWPPWLRLLIQVAIGVFTYLGLAAVAGLTAYSEIRDLVLKRRLMKILSLTVPT